MFLCFQCNIVCSYVGRFFSLCAILVKTYDASAECFHCYIAKCNVSRSKITAVGLNTPDIKIAIFLDHCNIFLFFCKLRKSLFYSRSRCCQFFF